MTEKKIEQLKKEFETFLKNYYKDNVPTNLNISIDERKLTDMFAKLEYAIKNDKKILIFGDYDVDGISSTTFTYEFIKTLGMYQFGKSPKDVLVDYVIPSRYENYGIDYDRYIDDFQKRYDYIIILDNGSHESFYGKLTQKDKSKITIVDHHPNGNFAKEDCIINPNVQGDLEISTGFLMQKIFERARKHFEDYGKKVKPYQFLDLAAMSMISDMANLNSKIVRNYIVYGIRYMELRKRAIYKEVFKNPNKKITLSDVSFNLIPMLNSAGRLAQDPTFAVDVLVKKRANKEWFQKYIQLAEMNKLRKDILAYYLKNFKKKDIFEKSFKGNLITYFLNEEGSRYEGYNVIGINGLIAGELNKFFGKDAISVSKHPFSNYLAGSGRGSNIKRQLSKIYEYCKEGTFEFGGHNQAVGIKIYDRKEFEKGVVKYIENEKDFIRSLEEKQRYYITDRIYSLDEYALLCKMYSDMSEDGRNIKFNDPFYVKLKAEVIGYKEYSRDYMKLILGNSFDDKIEVLNILTKKNSEIDYKDLEEQVFSIEVTPDIEYAKQNEFGNENIVKTQVNLFKENSSNNYYKIQEEEEAQCEVKNKL